MRAAREAIRQLCGCMGRGRNSSTHAQVHTLHQDTAATNTVAEMGSRDSNTSVSSVKS